MNGWLLLDKPSGITSRDVVNQSQAWFPKRHKLGHTGTLDPAATGLLVLCVGAATRFAEQLQHQTKTYLAQFRLGATSDTDDADGQVQENSDAKPIAVEIVQETLGRFVGDIEQVPPGYSAVKVAGRRAHKLARRGLPIDLKPRPITVYQLELLNYTWPDLEVRVSCSKGTYIRSLARDLGVQLGCGGLVQTLRRTQVGSFRVDEALPLDVSRELVHARLLPIDAALEHIPKLELADDVGWRFVKGQQLPVGQPDCHPIRVYSSRFLGLAQIEKGVLKPMIVVNQNAEME
jgi:tRNA pseudouridine55 synthase